LSDLNQRIHNLRRLVATAQALRSSTEPAQRRAEVQSRLDMSSAWTAHLRAIESLSSEIRTQLGRRFSAQPVLAVETSAHADLSTLLNAAAAAVSPSAGIDDDAASACKWASASLERENPVVDYDAVLANIAIVSQRLERSEAEARGALRA
jgi:hypothetical protein